MTFATAQDGSAGSAYSDIVSLEFTVLSMFLASSTREHPTVSKRDIF